MVLPFQNCCLSRAFVQVSYKQLRPYKDWEQRRDFLVSLHWWLEKIFLHSRASLVVFLLSSILVFSHLPCRKPNNQANRKIPNFAIILHFNLYYWLGAYCSAYCLGLSVCNSDAASIGRFVKDTKTFCSTISVKVCFLIEIHICFIIINGVIKVMAKRRE